MDDAALQFLKDNLHGHEKVDSPVATSDLVVITQTSKIVSLEEFQEQPNQIKQSPSLFSCASFCQYINRFAAEDSTVYLDVDKGRFTAVLDHHGSDEPRWCRHKATFAPKQSLEWTSWRGVHKKPQSQLDLAQFIEERIDDISSPEPNKVLQAALDFQANEKLALGSHQNLDSGTLRFTFTKDNAARNVDFPHRIKIAIPLHENEERQELEVRIRYRVDGNGALAFTVSFVKNPDALMRAALVKLASTIRQGTGDLAHYEGAL
jgi:uncharacterized protein YfdQ (DUF2303 family)